MSKPRLKLTFCLGASTGQSALRYSPGSRKSKEPGFTATVATGDAACPLPACGTVAIAKAVAAVAAATMAGIIKRMALTSMDGPW